MNALPLPGMPDLQGPAADTAVTLARIEVKLDQALTGLNDHEERLRALESRNWPRQALNLWVAALAACAAVAAVVEGLVIR